MVWAIHLRIGLEDPSGPLSTSSSEYSVIQRLKQSNREKPAQIHHTPLQPHYQYKELSLASHDHTGPSPFFSFKSRWTPPCRTCEGGGINLHPLALSQPHPTSWLILPSTCTLSWAQHWAQDGRGLCEYSSGKGISVS